MARADGGVRDLDGVRAAFASAIAPTDELGSSQPRRVARTRISRDVGAPTRTRRVRAVSSRIGGDATANARGWRTSGRGDGVGAHVSSRRPALAAKLEFHASRREWENNYWCDVYVGDVRGGTPRGETLGALMDVAVAFREALDAAVAATPSNPTSADGYRHGPGEIPPGHASLANARRARALETRATHDALARALWTITEGSAWDSTKIDDAMRRFVERREAEVDAAERSFADAV